MEALEAAEDEDDVREMDGGLMVTRGDPEEVDFDAETLAFALDFAFAFALALDPTPSSPLSLSSSST